MIGQQKAIEKLKVTMEPTMWLHNVWGLPDDEAFTSGEIADLVEDYYRDFLKAVNVAIEEAYESAQRELRMVQYDKDMKKSKGL